MKDAPLSFTGIEKRYNGRPVLCIDHLALLPGHILHLTGRNGAGKTTLLKILAGLEPPDRCEVDCDGLLLPWRSMRPRLQSQVVYLHQQPFMFDASVEQNLGYGLRVTGVARAERRRRIAAALARMELEYAARRNARTLSGGEQQRLALARAWVLRPRVLLLDEPTANLDQDFRRQTWALLRRMLDGELAIMVSSHELSAAENPCFLNLHLQEGRLSSGKPALQLVRENPTPTTPVPGAMP